MVKLYSRERVPKILHERMERLGPIIKYFEDKGYAFRYTAGRLALVSERYVVEFYLNQGVRVIGREHFVDGRVGTRKRTLVNGSRNFTIDSRHPEQAIKAIETGEPTHVLAVVTEETEIDMAEP